MRRWLEALRNRSGVRESMSQISEIDVDQEIQELQEGSLERAEAEERLHTRMLGQIEGAIETMGDTEQELEQTQEEIRRARLSLERRKAYLAREKKMIIRRREQK